MDSAEAPAGQLERRVTPHGDGWLVESLQATGDARMPLIRVREEYAGPVAPANRGNRDAWCADRLVVTGSVPGRPLDAETEAKLLALGLTLHSAYPFSPVRVYRLPEADWDAAERWQDELGGLLEGSGLRVGKDHLLYPAATTPDDPRFPQQWALPAIRAPEAWDYTTGSAGAVVAVLDTGLNLLHEDFYAGAESNLWINPDDPPDGIDNDGNGLADDVYGWDFVNASGTLIEDTNGHGTMVSGILGARGNNGVGVTGVAWNLRILPLRAGAASFPNSVLAQAMDYVTDLRLRGHPIVATSNSYGYYPSEDPTPEEWSANEALGQAIERARRAGILVVTAAGNGGQNNDSPYVRHFFPSDAIHANVISVTGSTTTGALWGGSNYGLQSVDMAAPAVNILTTHSDGGYRTYTGTSMAAPHASGAAALLASLRPDLGPSWMRALILGSVAPVTALEAKVASGGRLDLATLLELASLPLDEAWKRLHWTEAELQAMAFTWEDNPDGDGWPHIMELAFGGDPRTADSRPAFVVREAAWQRGNSAQQGILATMEYAWSPLADGLVSRFFEYARDSRGPWIPAIPVSHRLLADDPATGLRTYEARFLMPHSPAFLRLRVEPGAQQRLRGPSLPGAAGRLRRGEAVEAAAGEGHGQAVVTVSL